MRACDRPVLRVVDDSVHSGEYRCVHRNSCGEKKGSEKPANAAHQASDLRGLNKGTGTQGKKLPRTPPGRLNGIVYGVCHSQQHPVNQPREWHNQCIDPRTIRQGSQVEVRDQLESANGRLVPLHGARRGK
jgi:hypothetical protein